MHVSQSWSLLNTAMPLFLMKSFLQVTRPLKHNGVFPDFYHVGGSCFNFTLKPYQRKCCWKYGLHSIRDIKFDSKNEFSNRIWQAKISVQISYSLVLMFYGCTGKKKKIRLIEIEIEEIYSVLSSQAKSTKQ